MLVWSSDGDGGLAYWMTDINRFHTLSGDAANRAALHHQLRRLLHLRMAHSRERALLSAFPRATLSAFNSSTLAIASPTSFLIS